MFCCMKLPDAALFCNSSKLSGVYPISIPPLTEGVLRTPPAASGRISALTYLDLRSLLFSARKSYLSFLSFSPRK